MSDKRVLVVDDEEDLRMLLRFELEAEGYEVLEASTGKEALDVVDAEQVGFVLLDISLPDLDGFGVLEELRRRGRVPGLPVIVVSAHADEARAARVLEMGGAGYLYKPFSAAELWDAVRKGTGTAP